jgi:hypothetical protein
MAQPLSELTSKSTSPAVKAKAPAVKRIKKEPEFYIFRLVTEHPKYHESASIFPPRVMMPNTDAVLFNYGTEEEPDLQPRQIRYIDGLKSIFVDEQEVNGPLPENLVSKQTNLIIFQDGHLNVPSWNKALYQFLILNNQCENQKNKLKTINNLYRLLDFGNSDENIVELGKKKDRAYDVARSAADEDMIPHAKFLGISFNHHATGEERDVDAIREDYKAKALENPEQFLLFANNPKVKIRYAVQKALDKGIITTGLVKGQLHWSSSKQMIAEIGVNKDAADAIADFACSEEGESFYKTLKTQL